MARFTILALVTLVMAPISYGAPKKKTKLSEYKIGSKITIYRKGIKPEIYRTTSVYNFEAEVEGVKTKCQLFLSSVDALEFNKKGRISVELKEPTKVRNRYFPRFSKNHRHMRVVNFYENERTPGFLCMSYGASKKDVRGVLKTDLDVKKILKAAGGKIRFTKGSKLNPNVLSGTDKSKKAKEDRS